MKLRFSVSYAAGGMALLFGVINPNQVALPENGSQQTMNIAMHQAIDSMKARVERQRLFDSLQSLKPIAAIGAKYDVVYTLANGTHIVRTGGSRAWRNNNPGNLRATEFAINCGAIGAAGGFAVFPDEDAGIRALDSLLRSNKYGNKSLYDAICTYAPPFENDTDAYKGYIKRLTGLSPDRRLGDLSTTELARVTRVIRQVEGWCPGTQRTISPDTLQYIQHASQRTI